MSRLESSNLEEDLVEELKIWKQVFLLVYGLAISFSETICVIVDNLDEHIFNFMDMINNKIYEEKRSRTQALNKSKTIRRGRIEKK